MPCNHFITPVLSSCSPCEVPECEKRPRTGFATCPSAGRQLRLRRARFDSLGYQVDGCLRPRAEGAG
eukprot:scaffold6411_cov62-Phaeocystis_antarctica.AAC.1